jgi:hypothetical protein
MNGKEIMRKPSFYVLIYEDHASDQKTIVKSTKNKLKALKWWTGRSNCGCSYTRWEYQAINEIPKHDDSPGPEAKHKKVKKL